MSFLDRIIESNQARFDAFLPLRVERWQVGWIHRDIVPIVIDSSPRFADDPDAIWFCAAPDDSRGRTEAVAAAVAGLTRRGLVMPQGEKLGVAVRLGTAPLFELDRGAARRFGVRTYAVHVNGYVRRNGKLFVWLRRPAQGGVARGGHWANMVDHVVPAGHSLEDVLVRRGAEQAGLPQELAAEGQAAGAISCVRECSDGLAPNTAFVFDLEVDPSFEPIPADGQMHHFALWPVDELRGLVSETRYIEPNSALVIIDFLVRHGMIAPSEPDYLELVYRLRSGLRPRFGWKVLSHLESPRIRAKSSVSSRSYMLKKK